MSKENCCTLSGAGVPIVDRKALAADSREFSSGALPNRLQQTVGERIAEAAQREWRYYRLSRRRVSRWSSRAECKARTVW